jgi:hypothetical protein
MYRSAVILTIGAVLAALVLIVCAQTMAVVEMLAVVDERAGSVHVMRGDEAQSATLGMLVRSGERIRTGADGRVGIHWADGSRAELGPDSELVIERCRLNKLRHTRTSHFRLNLGQIWIRIHGILQPGSKFEVETPTIVAAVRGTIFGLRVAQDGTTRLEVYRGEVDIVDNGISQPIESGAKGKAAVVGRRRFEVQHFSDADAARWREKWDIIGPRVEISEPVGESTTSVALAPVCGITETAAAVTVNGERVRINSRGVFRTRARLTTGPNVVTVVATMGDLRTVVVRKVTYANPTAAIALTCRRSTDAAAPAGAMEVKAVLRNAQGELVPDGTPTELFANRGSIIRYHRTTQGTVVEKWYPAKSAAPARVTVKSGSARATAIVAPPGS